MEYKLKPINIDIKTKGKGEVVMPADIKDRVIEKRGHVVTFTMNEIEANTQLLLKNRKEIQAKKDFEDAKMKNIEAFHAWVKRISDERLFTAWMYQEAKGIVKLCNDKLAEIDKQIADDEVEVAEIRKQIPELAKSQIVEETEKMLKDNEQQIRKNKK